MSAPCTPVFSNRCLDRGRHDLGVALVADPALFPAVIELFAFAAEMIDEIDRVANGCRGISR